VSDVRHAKKGAKLAKALVIVYPGEFEKAEALAQFAEGGDQSFDMENCARSPIATASESSACSELEFKPSYMTKRQRRY
jgi:hypothetical protein